MPGVLLIADLVVCLFVYLFVGSLLPLTIAIQCRLVLSLNFSCSFTAGQGANRRLPFVESELGQANWQTEGGLKAKTFHSIGVFQCITKVMTKQ